MPEQIYVPGPQKANWAPGRQGSEHELVPNGMLGVGIEAEYGYHSWVRLARVIEIPNLHPFATVPVLPLLVHYYEMLNDPTPMVLFIIAIQRIAASYSRI